MATFLLTFIILVLLAAGMAIGVMRSRAPISGTCGGLNNMGAQGACEICGGNPAKCESENESKLTRSNRATFFDAMDENR